MGSKVSSRKSGFVSRIIDKDDWQIDAYWFKFICSRFGCPTIDRFADMFNTKLRRFNSRFYCHQSEGVDAFASDWAGEFNLLVPPIHLIPRVWSYLELCAAYGMLIIPYCPSSHFWPSVARIIERDDLPVTDMMYLGDIFKRGRNKRSLFGSPFWKSQSLIMLIDFRSQMFINLFFPWLQSYWSRIYGQI